MCLFGLCADAGDSEVVEMQKKWWNRDSLRCLSGSRGLKAEEFGIIIFWSQ